MSPFFYIVQYSVVCYIINKRGNESSIFYKDVTMKFILLACLLALSVSCGKNSSSNSKFVPAPAPVEPDVSIFSYFVADEGLHGLLTLDFRGLKLYAQNDIGLEEACSGTYGNSGYVNGAEPSKVLFTGTLTEGIMQIGHTKYVGASDPVCRQLSKETYTYSIKGTKMTLCMVNYQFCAEYQAVTL